MRLLCGCCTKFTFCATHSLNDKSVYCKIENRPGYTGLYSLRKSKPKRWIQFFIPPSSQPQFTSFTLNWHHVQLTGDPQHIAYRHPSMAPLPSPCLATNTMLSPSVKFVQHPMISASMQRPVLPRHKDSQCKTSRHTGS